MQRIARRQWLGFLTILLTASAFGSHPIAYGQEHPAPNSNKIGMTFRTFHPKEPYNWRGAQTHALTAVIWYPALSSAQEEPIDIPGLSSLFVLGSAAQNAGISPSPGQFPLIVISHGTGGSGLSMSWLGTALAAHGYIVAAVNHPGNNGAEAYTVEGFSTWWERARDLSEVISGMLADETFGKHIDANRIAAAGFSLGGYTMIEIAGGLTDPMAFLRFCDSANADDLCKSPPEFPNLVSDFRKLVSDHPEFLQHAGDSYRDRRVRSVFAIAPALGPAFPQAVLGKISVPVQIVAGEGDQNVPIGSSAKYFAAAIPGAKLKLFPANVRHYAFLDSCTPGAVESRPVLCKDDPGVDRDAVHAQTVKLAVEFFRATLK